MAKKRMVAVINECCTGCAGTPVCEIFCPTDGALEYVYDDGSFHFRRMRVNPEKCIGCRSCVARGYKGARIEGCPWDAITMESPGESPTGSER